MLFDCKQSFVRCVTMLKTAARETTLSHVRASSPHAPCKKNNLLSTPSAVTSAAGKSLGSIVYKDRVWDSIVAFSRF